MYLPKRGHYIQATRRALSPLRHRVQANAEVIAHSISVSLWHLHDGRNIRGWAPFYKKNVIQK